MTVNHRHSHQIWRSLYFCRCRFVDTVLPVAVAAPPATRSACPRETRQRSPTGGLEGHIACFTQACRRERFLDISIERQLLGPCYMSSGWAPFFEVSHDGTRPFSVSRAVCDLSDGRGLSKFSCSADVSSTCVCAQRAAPRSGAQALHHCGLIALRGASRESLLRCSMLCGPLCDASLLPRAR